MNNDPNELKDTELEQVKGGAVGNSPGEKLEPVIKRRVRRPTDQTNGIFSDMDFNDA